SGLRPDRDGRDLQRGQAGRDDRHSPDPGRRGALLRRLGDPRAGRRPGHGLAPRPAPGGPERRLLLGRGRAQTLTEAYRVDITVEPSSAVPPYEQVRARIAEL